MRLKHAAFDDAPPRRMLSTGKGLLGRVVLMVARAGYAECYTAPETHWIDLK